MAYDSTRGVVVLFGGDDGAYRNDTWEWNGTEWTERDPVARPGPRFTHAMAYDSSRGVIVLFGGRNASGYLNDTWEWDGINWTQRSPASQPPARNGHAMAFDAGRGVVVLFGGNDTFGGNRQDHWEWNGLNWMERNPATRPPARREHAMTYDSVRAVVVLFGGCCYQSDTWEWNGYNWAQRSPDNPPAARDGHAVAYDSARGVVVLFGGWGGSSRLHDTWEWDGANWEDRGVPEYPPARSCHALAYDSARSVAVLFGGTGGMTDTWEWNGTDWSERNPANHPPGRCYHSMAYDVARGVVVLFGGSGRDDTWEWDGTDWTQRNPDPHPSAREGHAMAYDRTRGVVVLFGGSGGGLLDDTWEWNGVNWIRRTPAHNPSARHVLSMAYDSAREVVVLFGGWDGWYQDDTWEWDGSDWMARNPATRPPALVRLAMAFDSARDLVVLFGGNDYDYRYDDTWEWDGTNWRLGSTVTHPPARNEHAMAYDTSREAVVLFGGDSGGGQLAADTWLYAPLVPRPFLAEIDNPDGDGGYVVAWSAVSIASSYTLEEDDDPWFGSPLIRYQGGDTELSVAGQGAGSWYYRVRASSAEGSSPWSDTQSVGVVPLAPILSPISNPGGDGDYLLDWNDVAGATAYQLEEDEYSSFPSPSVRYQGSATQFPVDAQPSGTWFYRVRASNAGGDGPWSNVESVGVAPPAPTLLPIENSDGDGTYLVEWNGAAGATGYTLQQDDSPSFPSPTVVYEGSNREHTIVGQSPGTWFHRVQATNPGGGSPWSAIRSASVLPAAPTLAPISNPDGDGDFLVTWSEALGGETYTVQEDSDPAFASAIVRYQGAGTAYEATGLLPGAWYYRARASNPAGDGPWSNTESVVVDEILLEAPLLSPIENPDGDGDYVVGWSTVASATAYTLQEDDNQGFSSPSVVYEGGSTQRPVSGQPTGTWYYRVRASNDGGASPWSQTQSVTVVVPAAPSAVYLSLISRGFFHDPYEPNNRFDEAWGPLLSGPTYQAYFPAESDTNDFYFFDQPGVHSAEIWLRQTPPGNDYALYLYDAAHVLIGYSDEYGSDDEHILVTNAAAGRYYVRVQRVEGTSRVQPYSLVALYR